MKLVIFDLDQTLVDVIAIHNGAAEKVFLSFFGVSARLTEVDFAGRSLGENFLAMARLKGIAEDRVRDNLSRMLVKYEESFVKSLPVDAERYVLPGVGELLEELQNAGHLLVLYTGDSRVVAEKILEATGLRRYFRLCFFGTEVEKRSEMVGNAIKEAERLTGEAFPGRQVVVVGDSIRDIESGREFGAETVAIATGFHTAKELEESRPDHLFADLGDPHRVAEAIGE